MEVNAKDRKYYWLKLPKDFFKSGTVQIIEAMPDGLMCSHFYIKALCESIEWNGCLMLNEKFPHDEETLAAVMKMDAETVHKAIDTLSKYGLLERTAEGVYYLPEFESMVGSETYWAQRKREQRERFSITPETDEIGQCPTMSNHVQQMSNREEQNREETKQRTKREKTKKETELFVGRSDQQSHSSNTDVCMSRFGIPASGIAEFIGIYTQNKVGVTAEMVNKYVGQGFDLPTIGWLAETAAQNAKNNPSSYFERMVENKRKDGVFTQGKLLDDEAKTDEDYSIISDKICSFSTRLQQWRNENRDVI